MSNQLSFSDYEPSLRKNKEIRSRRQLEKINRVIDWKEVGPLIKEADYSGKQGGRKPIDLLKKVKMLFVQYPIQPIRSGIRGPAL